MKLNEKHLKPNLVLKQHCLRMHIRSIPLCSFGNTQRKRYHTDI